MGEIVKHYACVYLPKFNMDPGRKENLLNLAFDKKSRYFCKKEQLISDLDFYETLYMEKKVATIMPYTEDSINVNFALYVTGVDTEEDNHVDIKEDPFSTMYRMFMDLKLYDKMRLFSLEDTRDGITRILNNIKEA